MTLFAATDWSEVFRPEMSPLEILVRGTIVYIVLCLLMRVVLKRQSGKIALPDLLVFAIVAGVSRNGLVRNAYSITDGVGVIAVVLAWSYALDYLCFHFPLVHRLLHSPDVVPIRDGKVLDDNLRRELMTNEQLCSQLRQHGIEDPEQVAIAILEGSGHVSVIPKPTSNGRGDGMGTRAHDLAVRGEMVSLGERLRQDIAWHEGMIVRHQQTMADLRKMLKDSERGNRRSVESN
jgi:uncharacterized membrane protein YcaP (DUF421 family)